MQHVGLPYIWGGDDPIKGFDCSGFVQELLASVGADPPGDQTSHDLYQYFKTYGWRHQEPTKGALVFFGSTEVGQPPEIIHVAMCIDKFRMVEAAGGGRTTHSVETAARQNAYIRIRPIHNRPDFIECIKPRYKLI